MFVKKLSRVNKDKETHLVTFKHNELSCDQMEDYARFVSTDSIVGIKRCDSVIGVEHDIGNSGIRRVFWENYFCTIDGHEKIENCTCSFVDQYPIYVAKLKNGKRYLIHPDDQKKMESLTKKQK